jgi:hypothetical protein
MQIQHQGRPLHGRFGVHAIAIATTTIGFCTGAAADGTPDNVDTGIRKTQCYATGSNALVSCATADLTGQDGQLGRDTYPATNGGADGRLGFSFTKLCNSGEVVGTGNCPADAAPGDGLYDWGCIVDNVTGIMVEVKTSSGYRASDLKYTNYSSGYDPVGQFGKASDAAGFVRAVNRAQQLVCGFDDWELAHTDKIQPIIDFGVAAAGAPRVDTAFFPNTNADWYWNASPNPSSPSTAFGVNFADGSADNFADRSTLRYVQVQRNGKPTYGPNGRYEYSADGSEVHDTASSARLTWRRCVEGMSWNGTTCIGTPLTFTHEEALQRAMAQAQASGEPWRVPSVKEQNWLVQRIISSPPIDHVAFPNTPAAASWTSSPEVRRSKNAWAIDFGVGLIVTHARSERLYLRLARDPDF